MVLDHLLTGGTGLGLGGLADAVLQLNDVSVPLWVVAIGVICVCLLVLLALEAAPRVRASRRAPVPAAQVDDTPAGG